MVVPGAGGAAQGRRQDAARRRVRSRRLAVGAAPGRVLGAGSRASRAPTTRRAMARGARRDDDGAARREAETRTWASRSRRSSSSASTRSSSCRRPTRRASRPGCAREVQHPGGRGRRAGALRPRQVEVLRREGRHQEGEARRAGRRAAVAAALRVRRERAAPAGAPRACSTRRQAGSDRLRHPPDGALRGRELREHRSSRRTSKSPTACATTSPRSTPSCSTPPSRRWGARSSSPSTRGRRPACDPCPTPPLSAGRSRDAGTRRARRDRRGGAAGRPGERTAEPSPEGRQFFGGGPRGC